MKSLSFSIVLVFIMLANVQAQDELFSPCLKCDLEGVKKAISDGANVNTPHSSSGQSALAYSYHCPEVTKYLLEQGGDPNGGSYPALVSASSIAALEVMKMLIDNGADPSLKGGGEPPLFKIVQMTNCAECADLLLTKGADKSTKGGIYANLFRVFAGFGVSQEERLVAMKAYGNLLKGYGLAIPDSYFTPFEVINGTPLAMAKILTKHGIDPTEKSDDGNKPLDIARQLLKASPKSGKASKQEIVDAILEANISNTTVGDLTGASSGKSDLADATSDLSKIKAKADWPAEGRKSKNGGGWSVNPNVLGHVPKRVALVTFYLEDPGTSEESQTETSTHIYYSASIWATEESKADEHIAGFYDSGIGALVKAFAKYDMELLLPDQYLDTKDKKTFYNNFEVKHGKLKKTKETSKAGTAHLGLLEMDRYRATAQGYKTIIVANERVNYYGKMYNFLMDSNESAFFQSMGFDLAKGLGVDAVVTVCLVTRKIKKDKENYALNHASMYMFGPNPTQLPEEEDKGIKGKFYVRGQFYCGARINYDKPVYFQKSGKKGTVKGAPVYAGMDNIMIALTDKIGGYFQKRLEK